MTREIITSTLWTDLFVSISERDDEVTDPEIKWDVRIPNVDRIGVNCLGVFEITTNPNTSKDKLLPKNWTAMFAAVTARNKT